MTDILKFIPRGESSHRVLFAQNDSPLGDIYMEVDGYYVFEFVPHKCGFLESHVLRAIADKLDELDKAWHEQVCKAVASVPKDEPQ